MCRAGVQTDPGLHDTGTDTGRDWLWAPPPAACPQPCRRAVPVPFGRGRHHAPVESLRVERRTRGRVSVPKAAAEERTNLIPDRPVPCAERAEAPDYWPVAGPGPGS